MTEEEMIQYYVENDIRPASVPDGASEVLEEYEVSSHLSKRFSQYTTWSKSSNTGYVADTYGGNPVEIDEYDAYIQQAKANANITYNAIGCGPLSMVSQFDYLARYAGYLSISSNLESSIQTSNAPARTSLATEIFENTDTIPADSFLGQLFGVDPNAGTFTFLGEVINSSREILENHYLAIKKTETIVDEEGNTSTRTYYDNDSMIIVNGDTVPNLSSFSTKINNLKDSIDNGMPVIWWTLGESKAGAFGNHFMNIFGYEYWIGTDELGNTKTHLMFILRYNWGINAIYMDSDVLDAVNGGFIFFEETHEKNLIMPSDYDYACQYFFDERTKIVTPTIGNNFTTKYLRAGYVNRYDNSNTTIVDQQISLSSKRNNAGVAYIHYKFDKPVEWIYLQASWWSTAEGMIVDKALIQYKDNLGNWVTQFDLQEDVSGSLSSLIDYKSNIRCTFDNPITEFRIFVKCNNPIGDKNKGRLVIGALNVFFE